MGQGEQSRAVLDITDLRSESSQRHLSHDPILYYHPHQEHDIMLKWIRLCYRTSASIAITRITLEVDRHRCKLPCFMPGSV